MTEPRSLVVGISGASGTIYAIRFIEHALHLGHSIHLVVTPSAWRVMQVEYGLTGVGGSSPLSAWLCGASAEELSRVSVYNNKDCCALLASGTFRTHAMIIIPASMKTVAGLASGYSEGLLLRAGDVFIKERRPLVIVPRETPLSAIHLRNMATLAEAGVHVLPAMPGFYHDPKSLDDLADFIVMKVFDVLGMEHRIPHSWRGPDPASE